MSRITEALSSIGSQGAITFESLRRLGEAIERELNERDVSIKAAMKDISREQLTSLPPPLDNGNNRLKPDFREEG